MSWDKWAASLKGEKVVHHPSPDDTNEGFYRIPVKEKHPTNGTNKTVGWIPVCYYVYDGKLTGNMGVAGRNREMTPEEVDDKWTWCCNHPIPEDWYRAVAEKGGVWPDVNATPEKPADDPKPEPEGKRTSDNTPPPPAEQLPPDVEHANGIRAAINAAIYTVTSEEEASSALGSKNRIAELRLAATKAGKAIYEPMYRAYTAEQKKWSPMIKAAEDAEKKLNTAVLTFREKERKRIAAENAKREAETLRLKEEEEARNQAAADRAIAAGAPEPAPVVVETAPPVVETAAPVKPTYGTRTVKEEVKFHLDAVTSWDLLFNHYKHNADVQALLMKLATADIKAGRTVPGTTTREGLI